jgi:hypothetical protein
VAGTTGEAKPQHSTAQQAAQPIAHHSTHHSIQKSTQHSTQHSTQQPDPLTGPLGGSCCRASATCDALMGLLLSQQAPTLVQDDGKSLRLPV